MSTSNSFLAVSGTYWSLTHRYSLLNSSSLDQKSNSRVLCPKYVAYCCTFVEHALISKRLKTYFYSNFYLLHSATYPITSLKELMKATANYYFFIALLMMIALEFITLRRHRALQVAETLCLKL